MEFADFKNAKWIWGADNKTPDQKIVFRKKLTLEDVPTKATAFISCETKFWLWINGKEVVFEGGVFRESVKGCGWAERVDISSFLQKGENVFSILAWFYGNGGRNNVNSGQAGLIMLCEAIGLESDQSFLCATHPAYVKSGEPHSSYLYGGDNVAYDASLDFGDFTAADFNSGAFLPATVYKNEVWGKSAISELPLLKVSNQMQCEWKKEDEIITVQLPYAMAFSACFECDALGGEIIDIRSDRYQVRGGPGDETNEYRGHRIEYICKAGKNVFVCPMYLYGEKILISAPQTVKFTSISYRESGYASELVGKFITENPLFNRLIEKSKRTLYVCMRNNFMDCPDRERGQWIGDVSVQAPQVFFAFDKSAQKLLKKAILDFVNLRHGDVLVGNVPGEHSGELPSQSLVAISEFGLVAEYYNYSLDSEIPSLIFEPMIAYLKQWETDKNGILIARSGDWYWFDHLHNIDDTLLENCIYVSACKFALKMANLVGNKSYDDFLTGRIEKISKYINENYFNGRYYSSGKVVDERANAFAVLSGICPKEHYPSIRRVILSLCNCTPYMERFVLVALCEMGYIEDAYKRMMARYYNLIINENTTLWEDFSILGTRNHAWSSAPIEIAFKYFLGFKTTDAFKSYTINPCKNIFEKIHCELNVGEEKKIIDLDFQNDII